MRNFYKIKSCRAQKILLFSLKTLQDIKGVAEILQMQCDKTNEKSKLPKTISISGNIVR